MALNPEIPPCEATIIYRTVNTKTETRKAVDFRCFACKIEGKIANSKDPVQDAADIKLSFCKRLNPKRPS